MPLKLPYVLRYEASAEDDVIYATCVLWAVIHMYILHDGDVTLLLVIRLLDRQCKQKEVSTYIYSAQDVLSKTNADKTRQKNTYHEKHLRK